MDLAQGVRVLLRRWFIVLLGLGLTLGAAYSVYEQSPTSYATNSRMILLLPPGAQGAELPNSPFIYLPAGLNILAQLLRTEASTHRFQEGLVEDGYTATFAVGVDSRDPILTVSVEGGDPDMVLETRDEVIERIVAELDLIQDEEQVPDRQRAHIRTSGVDDVAQEMGGSRLQAAAGTIAAGGLVTLLLTFLIDRWAVNRAARRGRPGRRPARQRRPKDRPARQARLQRAPSRSEPMRQRAAVARRNGSTVHAAQP